MEGFRKEKIKQDVYRKPEKASLSKLTMEKKDWCSWSVQHHEPVAVELERVRTTRGRARSRFVLCGGDHLLRMLVVRL